MKEQRWRGTWWLPNEPADLAHGTLTISETGQLRLELVGGFDTAIRTPLPSGGGYAVSMESKDLPVIHGVSSGEIFTLLDCQETRSKAAGFQSNHVEQDLSPNRALRGIHLVGSEESVFTTGYLQLERLLHWADKSTFEVRIKFSNDRKRVQEGSATTRELPPAVAHYGDLSIRLRVRSTDFNVVQQPVANRRSVESVEWATLVFERSSPAPYHAFDLLNKDMQDLLTLCAYDPCGAESQALDYRRSDAQVGSRETQHVEVLGHQIYQTPATSRDGFHHEYLLTLSDMPFSELVPRWLELKHRARLGCNILFGLRYIGSGYVGTRLLGVATAAENIHDALCGEVSAPLPRAKYMALKRKLLAAIEDEKPHIRGFVNQGLHNNASYRDRMLTLASVPDSAAVDQLLEDRGKWATMLKNARNDLAHANERSAQDQDSTPAFWLLEVTYALLHLVLIAKLGFGPDIQRRVVQHQKVSWAAGQFKRAIGADKGDDA